METINAGSNIAIVIKSDNSDDPKDSDIKGDYFINVEELQVNSEDHETQFVAVSEDYVNMAVEESDGVVQEKEIIVWEGLCRICANESDRFIQIFSGEGVEHELTTKIHSHLPIKVSEDDDLPHQVCYTCAATLVAWHDLKNGCVDAQNRLMELKNKFTSKVEYVDDSALAEDDNVNGEDDESNTHIFLREDGGDSESNFEQMEVVDIAGKGRRDQRPTENNDVGDDSKKLNSFKYMCGVCEQLFEDEIKLVCHLNADHSEGQKWRSFLYECHLCNKAYQRKSNLVSHLEAHATVEERIAELPSEEVAAANARIYVNHIQMYKCTQCKHVLHNKRAFIRHLRLHTNARPHTCPECGKKFRCKEDVRRHNSDVHKKVKRHACDICNAMFAAKATRDAHRRIHTGEKPFQCEICQKNFRSVNLLGVHKRCHADVRPYGCNFCEKAFRSKQKLDAHEAIHTGIRPYPCDVCKKTFAAQGEAKRHRAVHFDDKPFLCNVCGMTFKLNRYLRIHLKAQHKDERYDLLQVMDKN